MGFRIWIFVAGILGAFGVIIGAMGAHMLQDSLEGRAEMLFEKAWRYHMLHVVALMLTAIVIWLEENALELRSSWTAHAAAWLFLLGILLFSGVLYMQALAGGEPRLPVVPVGGSAFLLGWILLGISGLRIPKI